MRKYEKYKDSNVPWIGEIPEHWDLKRMRFVARLYNGNSLNDTDKSHYADTPDDDDSVPYIASKDIDRDTEFIDYTNGIRIPKNEPDFKVAPAGTSLLCIEGGSAGKKMGFVNQDVCFVNKLCCFDAVINNKFLYYYIKSKSFWEVFSQNIQGMIGGVTISRIKDFAVPVPSDEEQDAIVAYLDKKCGDIDNAIATQQKRIDLLKEQEQGIIACAILKGLEPKAEMFDSGIDYIGQIPAHWTIMPIKYTAQGKECCFIDGDWIESKDISSDGIKYLTTGNVGPNKYKEQGSGYITEEKFKELDCKDVYSGDLLISRLNEPIARTCIVPDLGTRIVTAVDNVIFRPNPRILDRKFAAYYLNNVKFTEHANIIARGATMHRISRTMLGHLKIALPPVEEQKQIVSYLEDQIAPIEAAISTAEKKVELLRSYKQSLVTEVVTGKRKVL